MKFSIAVKILRVVIAIVFVTGVCQAQTVLDIGSRRELFVDDYLIDKLVGATQRLHEPVKREVVMVFDQPWEDGVGYYSVFQDGDVYRLYYRVSLHSESSDTSKVREAFLAYAESRDGVHWYRPSLWQHEFNGSRDNNILFASGKVGVFDIDAEHPAVFKDENPNAPADERYKAILVQMKRPKGLVAFKSPDGLRWTPMASELVITNAYFDSQNLAFWDPTIKKYRAYYRTKAKLDPADVSRVSPKSKGILDTKKYRAILTAVSDDFINWEELGLVKYQNTSIEELYTNVVKPYHRAPHILMGFPVRYIEREWSSSYDALPELEERKKRGAQERRFGTALTESLFMTSRDGKFFKRWDEAFLRPGIERPGTWTYGDNFLAWHLVETKSDDEGAPNELSFYATENQWKGTAIRLRRYTLRLDGFVSVNAPASGGELLTKPFTFKGSRLALNFSTSASGDIYVELTDEKGRPLPGFTMKDCDPIFGDAIERTVVWKNGSDVSKLEGKTIRIRFKLADADLYAMKFQ